MEAWSSVGLAKLPSQHVLATVPFLKAFAPAPSQTHGHSPRRADVSRLLVHRSVSTARRGANAFRALGLSTWQPRRRRDPSADRPRLARGVAATRPRTIRALSATRGPAPMHPTFSYTSRPIALWPLSKTPDMNRSSGWRIIASFRIDLRKSKRLDTGPAEHPRGVAATRPRTASRAFPRMSVSWLPRRGRGRRDPAASPPRLKPRAFPRTSLAARPRRSLAGRAITAVVLPH